MVHVNEITDPLLCQMPMLTMPQSGLRKAYSILAIQFKDVDIPLDQSWGEELQSLCCETLSVSLDELKIKFSVPVKFSQCRIQSLKCLDWSQSFGIYQNVYTLTDQRM